MTGVEFLVAHLSEHFDLSRFGFIISEAKEVEREHAKSRIVRKKGIFDVMCPSCDGSAYVLSSISRIKCRSCKDEFLMYVNKQRYRYVTGRRRVIETNATGL